MDDGCMMDALMDGWMEKQPFLLKKMFSKLV
jgi:hypothetical protein